ncbi:MAG: iron-containing alcohol dehydrogenase [Flavonifractor plautii]
MSTGSDAEAILRDAAATGCGRVVAIGGGTVIDIAKVLAVGGGESIDELPHGAGAAQPAGAGPHPHHLRREGEVTNI